MIPVSEPGALYSDESRFFRSPYEPDAFDTVTVFLRTPADGVSGAYLNVYGNRIPMVLDRSERGFDYYAGMLSLWKKPVTYYFSATTEEGEFFCGRAGLAETEEDVVPFRIIPGFRIPDWAEGAVMYQIFTDRFRDGNPPSDPLPGEYRYLNRPIRKVDDWYAPPEKMDVYNFYGGDLRGVLEKLDYLKELGIEAVYFNPLFVSPSNHKYDTQDYDHIDPHLTGFVRDDGTYRVRTTDPENLAAADAFFAEFVAAAHKKGIRVILDGVFNHCGSYHKWMNRERCYGPKYGYPPGAYESADSPYRDYFDFEENGDEDWPNNDSYAGWWDNATLPKLNYEASEELQEAILSVGRKWVSPPYCADGWRLDVAADLGHSAAFNHSFWKRFRAAVKEANPDALVFAEHYGDPSEWLNAAEWDTVMNYDAFMEPVSFFLTGMEKHSDYYREDYHGNGEAFFHSIRLGMRAFPGNALRCAMNQLDNHDHSRFLTRTNRISGRVSELGSAAAGEGTVVSILRAAAVMQMTWIGSPTLYYGDEAGVVGFTDPDSRRTYPWGREDRELLEFYRSVIRMHAEHEALKRGSLIELACEGPVIAYGRFTPNERIAVAVNACHEAHPVTIPVWKLGNAADPGAVYRCILETDAAGYVFPDEKSLYYAENGCVTVTVEAFGAIVFREVTEQTDRQSR